MSGYPQSVSNYQYLSSAVRKNNVPDVYHKYTDILFSYMFVLPFLTLIAYAIIILSKHEAIKKKMMKPEKHPDFAALICLGLTLSWYTTILDIFAVAWFTHEDHTTEHIYYSEENNENDTLKYFLIASLAVELLICFSGEIWIGFLTFRQWKNRKYSKNLVEEIITKLEEAETKLKEAKIKLEEGKTEESKTELKEGLSKLEKAETKLEEAETRLKKGITKLEEETGKKRMAKLEEGRIKRKGAMKKLEEEETGESETEGTATPEDEETEKSKAKLEERMTKLKGRLGEAKARLEEAETELVEGRRKESKDKLEEGIANLKEGKTTLEEGKTKALICVDTKWEYDKCWWALLLLFIPPIWCLASHFGFVILAWSSFVRHSRSLTLLYIFGITVMLLVMRQSYKLIVDIYYYASLETTSREEKQKADGISVWVIQLVRLVGVLLVGFFIYLMFGLWLLPVTELVEESPIHLYDSLQLIIVILAILISYELISFREEKIVKLLEKLLENDKSTSEGSGSGASGGRGSGGSGGSGGGGSGGSGASGGGGGGGSGGGGNGGSGGGGSGASGGGGSGASGGGGSSATGGGGSEVVHGSGGGEGNEIIVEIHKSN